MENNELVLIAEDNEMISEIMVEIKQKYVKMVKKQ